jgi:predicted dehydrogenase
MLNVQVIAGRDSEAPWRDAARRLRGAALAIAGEGQALDSQAVIFGEGSQPTADAVGQCLRAARHVLVATDPRFGPGELTSLVAAAADAGVQFAVVNPDRYLPSRQLIRQQVPQTLGQVGLVRAHCWEPGGGPSHTVLGLPAALVRELDVVLWLAGETPALAYATEAASGVHIHLGFSEAMALVDYTSALPAGADYRSLSVIGFTGAAYVDDHRNVQMLYLGGRPQGVRAEESPPRQLATLAQEFVDAVAAGRSLRASIDEWRELSEVVEAVQRSLAERTAVRLGNAAAKGAPA